MSDWLLKFGIGGVQEFISQSRKVRDLAASSVIVSEMSYTALEVAEASGVEIILPSKIVPDHCPHQIVLRLKQAEEEGIRRFAGSMKSAALAKWKSIAKLDEVKKRIECKYANCDESSIDNQRDSAFCFFWVAVPDDGNYPEAFGALAKAYDDRRHTRTFEQLKPLDILDSWACSVCGNRAAVLQPKGKEWPANALFVTKRERMCLVCASKRAHGMLNPAHVRSTYGLSRDRFFRMGVFEGIRTAYQVDIDWNELLDNLDELETLSILPSDSSEKDGDTLTKYLTVFNALKNESQAWRSLEKLSPYYALVGFDGDKMGEWVSGEHFRADVAANPAQFQEAQHAISKALFEFDKAVKAMKEDYPIELIYLGGDDGLLLCPLDLLLPLMKAIHEKWAMVGEAARTYAKPELFLTITLHASVVHAREPLQAALPALRNLLHKAKENGDRDCFSVLAAPRSGAPAHMIAKWDELAAFTTAVAAFSNWLPGDVDMPPNLDERNKGRIGAALGHAMLEAAPPFLTTKQHQTAPPLLDAFKRELDRMQERSEKKGNGDWEAVRNWLVDVRAVRGEEGAERFSRALQVVLFLARELMWRAES